MDELAFSYSLRKIQNELFHNCNDSVWFIQQVHSNLSPSCFHLLLVFLCLCKYQEQKPKPRIIDILLNKTSESEVLTKQLFLQTSISEDTEHSMFDVCKTVFAEKYCYTLAQSNAQSIMVDKLKTQILNSSCWKNKYDAETLFSKINLIHNITEDSLKKCFIDNLLKYSTAYKRRMKRSNVEQGDSVLSERQDPKQTTHSSNATASRDADFKKLMEHRMLQKQL